MNDRNQGEGNKDAARNYNKQTREFVENNDTEELARQAEPATKQEKHENAAAREKAASRARQ